MLAHNISYKDITVYTLYIFLWLSKSYVVRGQIEEGAHVYHTAFMFVTLDGALDKPLENWATFFTGKQLKSKQFKSNGIKCVMWCLTAEKVNNRDVPRIEKRKNHWKETEKRESVLRKENEGKGAMSVWSKEMKQ